jgi:hypothetical protein
LDGEDGGCRDTCERKASLLEDFDSLLNYGFVHIYSHSWNLMILLQLTPDSFD